MTTALSVTDQKVLERYESFVKKMQDIEQEEASYKTNGRFFYNPSNQHTQINIFSCNDEDLINVHSFIVTKAKAYYDSAIDLKIKQYPVFKWMGYTNEDWVHDIALTLRLREKIAVKDRLKKAIATLESILPDELKKQRILESIDKDDLPF